MRLIDASALKRDICQYCNDVCSDEPCEPSDCEHMRIIDNQPTIDAVEVVHGEWIPHLEAVWNLEIPVLCGATCSKCNTTWDAESNYCPNCGAKMDKGEET